MQYYQECIALGSMTGISLVSDASPASIEALYANLWQSIFLFERQFSRFVPSSELSRLNREAGTRQFISSEFRDILLAAKTIANETDGIYNPFVLPALQASGYVHSRVPGYEQDAVDNYSNRSVVTIERLEIGDDWARIPYGTALDLGGCGKGYLADQLRTKLPKTVTGYWLSLGGDIAAGGLDDSKEPWKITIQDARDPIQNIGTLTTTTSCGVATSGTTVHTGKKGGKAWHHLIDPRTHEPAVTDVLLATVCDTSALRADVFASCAVILGSKEGLQFLKKHGIRAAALQCHLTNETFHSIHYGNGIIIHTPHA